MQSAGSGHWGSRAQHARVTGALFVTATLREQAVSIALRQNTLALSAPQTRRDCVAFKTSSTSDRQGTTITARRLCAPRLHPGPVCTVTVCDVEFGVVGVLILM